MDRRQAIKGIAVGVVGVAGLGVPAPAPSVQLPASVLERLQELLSEIAAGPDQKPYVKVKIGFSPDGTLVLTRTCI